MKNDPMHKPLGLAFIALVVVILFTGFGNMPLWKRYYIADIQGLRWAGHFYRNVQVHYVAGALLLALAAYFLVAYAFLRYQGVRLTKSGAVRAMLLSLALITGIIMAVKNLPGINFPVELLVAFNLSHMGSAVFFMLVSIGAFFARKPWVVERGDPAP